MFFWYLNRLRLMPLPEIGLRLYRKVRAKIWKILLPWAWRRPLAFSKALPESPGDWLVELKRNFPINLEADFLERYARYFSHWQVKEAAENLVKGRIPVFHWIYDTGGEIPDWHRDFLAPCSWPRVFFNQLNHNDLRYGRVINVWELNRHFYFYDLGKAYYFTQDPSLAQTLLVHLESWIDQNLPGIGINWYSPMENAIRLISWLWGLFFISENRATRSDLSPVMTDEIQKKLLGSIYWQTYYIEKNLSKYSSANNHRIGEALALFWIGSLIPTFSRAKKWKEKGWEILCQEIERQIFPDGVPKEQSTRYLFFLFDLYCLAVLLAKKQNLAIPQVLFDRLEKICEYIMAQMNEGGNLPDLGDSSDGLACKLHTTSFHPYRSLLTTGAIWFNRGDFKYWGGKLDERNFWLFNKDDLDRYEHLQEDPTERKSQFFPEGGQIVLRKGKGKDESVLSFDAGPFGFLSIAAHAHADALSFTLSLGGIPILVDPGTYLYHDGGKWRYYFRGTRAHNTIEVDGQDQAVSGGPFMWLTKPETVVKKVSMVQDHVFVHASHKGYARLSFPLNHERSFLWNRQRESWTINDRLETQGPHLIRQTFHFHPLCRVQSLKPGLFEVSIDKPVLYLELDSRFQPSLHRGEEDPIWGWNSGCFGEKVPAFTLVGEMTIEETEMLQTLMWRP